VEIKFKHFSISISPEEVRVLKLILTEDYQSDYFAIDDWSIIDLLYKKHIIIYNKIERNKPELQPWCQNTVLRTLSDEQSGN
jgi:hypothetical protein